jgi:phenylacetate-coenzyme A ligase PaaK-like adenylate-forming protein
MGIHAAPPFDAWASLRAGQETWLASLDPKGTGQRLRAQRLGSLMELARHQSPLYARRAGSADALTDFKLVSKAELMAGFDDWATDRSITREAAERALRSNGAVADAWLDRYLLWTSSGTSGQPGIFVQDAHSLAAYDAIDTQRLRGAAPGMASLGVWGAGRRFAYVGAIGGPYAGYVNMERLRRLVPLPWTPQVELISVLEPLERIAHRLQLLQPDVLITYPSCATALAALQAGGRLQLGLTELWLGGEQLTPAQRGEIRGAFDCPVRNSYGASEFYSIAFECAHGQLHLNDDWVILEGLDRKGGPTPPGEFSHTTLLTNLANRIQPLLRYEMTDRVRFVPGACVCGSAFPVIEVQGRSDQALLLPGLRGGNVVLLALALESVLEEAADVTQFQLVQRTPLALELRLPLQVDGRRRLFNQCSQALQAFFARHATKPVRLQLSAQAPELQRGSGKLRRTLALPSAS